MYCPKCRNIIPDGSPTCSYCGVSIQVAPAEQRSYNSGSYGQQPYNSMYPDNVSAAQSNPYNSQPESYGTQPNPYAPSAYGSGYNPYGGTVATRKKPNVGLIAVVALVIVALVGGAYFIFNSSGGSVNMSTAQSSPENVLNAFVSAYNNRDAKTLVSLSHVSANATEEELEEYYDNAEKTFEFLNDKWKMEVEVISVDHVDDDTAKIKYNITIDDIGTNESTDTFVKIDGKWYIKAVI